MQPAAHLLGFALAGDVGAGSHPLDDLAVPFDRHGADVVVPVGAGPGPDPVPVVEGLPGLDTGLPVAPDPVPVLGMDRVQPAAAHELLQGLPGDPAPLGAVLGDLAVGVRDPDNLRTAQHQGAVALLAAPDGVLRTLAAGHIHRDQHDAGDVPAGVMRWEPGQGQVRGLPQGARRGPVGVLRHGAAWPASRAGCGRGSRARRAVLVRARYASRAGCGPSWRVRHAVLVCAEDGLILGQDLAGRRLGRGGELGRPDMGRLLPDMIFRAVAVQPGQHVVDPAEAEVGAEESETDRRLAQQCVEQRGVRRAELGHRRLRRGHVSAHRGHRCLMHRPAIGGSFLLPHHSQVPTAWRQRYRPRSRRRPHPRDGRLLYRPRKTVGLVALRSSYSDKRATFPAPPRPGDHTWCWPGRFDGRHPAVRDRFAHPSRSGHERNTPIPAETTAGIAP